MSDMSAGFTRFKAALGEVGSNPLHHLALVAAGLVSAVLTPLWGATFVNMGWLDARQRVADEGLVGLGAAFAPQQARAQFGDGVWTGLWRVQTLPIAVAAVGLPATLFALLPAVLVAGLMMPARMSFPGISGMVLGTALPAIVLAACLVAITAQMMLMLRLLGRSGPQYSVGLVFRVVGEAWRGTLADLPMLLGLGASVALTMIAGGIFVGISTFLATKLQLGMGGVALIAQWSGVALAFIVIASALEALAQWAEETALQPVDATGAWRFSSWLREWLLSAVRWFGGRGVMATGVGVSLAMGTVVSALAVMTGEVWTSWVGVAWFAVSAAVLVTLYRTGSKA